MSYCVMHSDLSSFKQLGLEPGSENSQSVLSSADFDCATDVVAFGIGIKQLGRVREAGVNGAEEYTQVRCVHIEFDQRGAWIV